VLIAKNEMYRDSGIRVLILVTIKEIISYQWYRIFDLNLFAEFLTKNNR
jgi:hypothetical protein